MHRLCFRAVGERDRRAQQLTHGHVAEDRLQQRDQAVVEVLRRHAGAVGEPAQVIAHVEAFGEGDVGRAEPHAVDLFGGATGGDGAADDGAHRGPGDEIHVGMDRGTEVLLEALDPDQLDDAADAATVEREQAVGVWA